MKLAHPDGILLVSCKAIPKHPPSHQVTTHQPRAHLLASTPARWYACSIAAPCQLQGCPRPQTNVCRLPLSGSLIPIETLSSPPCCTHLLRTCNISGRVDWAWQLPLTLAVPPSGAACMLAPMLPKGLGLLAFCRWRLVLVLGNHDLPAVLPDAPVAGRLGSPGGAVAAGGRPPAGSMAGHHHTVSHELHN
jgi:hypothetical protein